MDGEKENRGREDQGHSAAPFLVLLSLNPRFTTSAGRKCSRLLDEAHGVNPAQRVDQGLKATGPKLNWLKQFLAHRNTFLANSTTPTTFVLILSRLRVAVARSWSSQLPMT